MTFNKKNELTEIHVNFGDTKTVVRGEFLDGVRMVSLDGVSVLGPTNSASGKPLATVALVIPYHVTRFVNGKDQWYSSDVIRMGFKDGKMVFWSKAVAVENAHSQWKLTEWDENLVNLGVRDRGVMVRKLNPLGWFDYNNLDP
jgi:hypothetical protein